MNLNDLPSAAPDLTKAEARRLVILIRRELRKLAAWNDFERSAAQQARRAARRLDPRSDPFHPARVERFECLADAASAKCRDRSEAAKHLARTLLELAPAIDQVTTLAERCELLNINQIHRGSLTEEDGLVKLIAIHRLEDSAERRREGRRPGPLWWAASQVLLNFV